MFDLVVLGGGSGGLNVATAAAAVGAKVALVEKGQLGGECTHTACVPSKALIRAARVLHEARGASAFGVEVGVPRADFAAVMDRIRRVVASFAGSDSGQSLQAKGIEVFRGSPVFRAYDTVVVDGQTTLNAHRFVVATGSRPAIPAIPGLEEVGYLDNRTIWDLTALPETLLILGAGPVGLEFGQSLARLGSKVTILGNDPHVLPKEDPEVSTLVQRALEAEGIVFHLGVEVTGVARRGEKALVKFRKGNETFEAARDRLLVAAGRLANVEGLDLEAVGIHATPEHGIPVDENLQTSARQIYAIGDVLGHHQWTHAAEREASVAFQNAVLKLSKKVDYATIPWATFTEPEVATVGLNEAAARVDHPDARVFRAEYAELDRARIDGKPTGLAKVVATPGGKILGATIVGEGAADVLQEFVLAMQHGLSLADLADTVHPYPTYVGVARKLANQYMATKLEKGVVQTALRWIYGYSPR